MHTKRTAEDSLSRVIGGGGGETESSAKSRDKMAGRLLSLRRDPVARARFTGAVRTQRTCRALQQNSNLTSRSLASEIEIPIERTYAVDTRTFVIDVYVITAVPSRLPAAMMNIGRVRDT